MTEGRIPITEQISALGIQALGLCWASHPRRPGHSNHPYTLDCFGLLWTASGGVFENRELPRQHLQSGHLCLLVPGVEHCYGPHAGEPWREWLLFCDGWLPRRLLKEGHLSASRPLCVVGDWQTRWEHLRKQVEAGHVEACSLLAAEGFHALGAALRRPQRRQEDHPAWALADAMHREPARHWDFPTWAQSSEISYTALRQTFTRLIGRSPHQQLIHERLQLAARLLTEPLPVQEVCRLIGYADPAHFSRLFQRHLGQSPRAFQRSHAVMRG
ncbi:MAG: AraC family transcriptional regulator [Planctomycetota bacterium]|jgi:AraC-like DNA-binding protein|nr:AraC family transcriptional regulator [Planctomycetota bacterium]